jgi:NADH-quinone oxidoreductase subunit A
MAGMRSGWEPILVLLGIDTGGVAALHGLVAWLTTTHKPLETEPFSGGLPRPREHVFSQCHVRRYPVTMIFLAFDMEMLVTYSWVRGVSEVGTSTVSVGLPGRIRRRGRRVGRGRGRGVWSWPG